ncbi:MAG: DUF4340 domain-containing protein [Bacteroidota bacterium]
MKKKPIIIVLVLLLAVVAVIVIIKGSKKSTIDSPESTFAIEDTASITKIFMANMRDQKVTLSRSDSGSWMVNNANKASIEAINYFLKTIHNVQMKDVVPKKARNTIISLLATSATKVEIYQRVYFIDLFNRIKLFPHEKLTKTYYVGMATQDNMGTYMLVDGSETPFITYLPGFNGYLSSRYSVIESDWLDHTVFNIKYNNVHAVSVDNYDSPDQSFKLVKNGPRAFSVYTLHGNKEVMKYDTTKVMDYFTGFENLRYEAILTDLTADSRAKLTSKPYMLISVEEMSGKTVKIKTFHKDPVLDPIMGEDTLQYDGDRLYALIHDDNDLALIQFFVFGQVFRTLDYFSGKAIPPNEAYKSIKSKSAH